MRKIRAKKRRTAISPMNSLLGIYASIVAATYFYTTTFALYHWVDYGILMGLFTYAAIGKLHDRRLMKRLSA
jgi:CDP-diglyceride synthetase